MQQVSLYIFWYMKYKSLSIPHYTYRLWINQFKKVGDSCPGYPRFFTYGLLRANSIENVLMWCDKEAIDRLGTKFAHSEVIKQGSVF